VDLLRGRALRAQSKRGHGKDTGYRSRGPGSTSGATDPEVRVRLPALPDFLRQWIWYGVAHSGHRVKEGMEKTLATDPEVRVRLPALPDFLTSNWTRTWSTQPREYN
jgi:hypothetical protein